MCCLFIFGWLQLLLPHPVCRHEHQVPRTCQAIAMLRPPSSYRTCGMCKKRDEASWSHVDLRADEAMLLRRPVSAYRPTLTWTLYARELLLTRIGMAFPFLFVYFRCKTRSFALRARGLEAISLSSATTGCFVHIRKSASYRSPATSWKNRFTSLSSRL